MRLIRLTTEDRTGIFDNHFNQDIIITPQSKVALKSMSIENELKQITINSANDKIDFQVQDNQGTLTTQLSHATYDTLSAPSLFLDISIQMNKVLRTRGANVGRNIGLEIRNRIGTDKNFRCQMAQGSLSENTSSLVLNKGVVAVNKTGAAGFGIFSSSGTPSGNDSFFYDPTPMARGGGMVRFKVNTMGNTTDNFILGFTTTNPDTLQDGATFNLSDIKYGIKAQQSSSPYQSIFNGTLNTSSTIPNYVGSGSQNNDDIVLSVDQGKMSIQVYQSGVPDGVVLQAEDYTYPTDLYPVVIFLGDSAHTSIRLFRFTQSPYHNEPQPPIVVVAEELSEGKLNAPPNQFPNATKHFLQYESNTLSTFLGFNNPRIPQQGTISSKDFIATADNIFKAKALSDAFLVELMNIQLSSYDGLTSERKSYLSVVPETDKDQYVIYDATYPIFIDIQNTQPLTLRNIKARILYADGTPISMLGLGTLVFLIEDGEKREIKLTD